MEGQLQARTSHTWVPDLTNGHKFGATLQNLLRMYQPPLFWEEILERGSKCVPNLWGQVLMCVKFWLAIGLPSQTLHHSENRAPSMVLTSIGGCIRLHSSGKSIPYQRPWSQNDTAPGMEGRLQDLVTSQIDTNGYSHPPKFCGRTSQKSKRLLYP